MPAAHAGWKGNVIPNRSLRWSRGFIAVAVSLTVACALSSSDHYSDGVCPEGTKLCGDACVSKGNPDYGCGAIGCSPCDLARAQAVCSADGKCSVASCYAGRGDCNADPKDGCETDIASSADSCGSCTNRCSFSNATATCNKGACVMFECHERYDNCNGRESDGCETDLLQAANCGKCGLPCAPPKVCKERRVADVWSAVCESEGTPSSDASTEDASSGDAGHDAGDDGGEPEDDGGL